MSNIDLLVIFSGTYGQTLKISEHIVDLARRRGLTAKAVRVEQAANSSLRDEASAVVVAAPVYFGRHPREVRDFMKREADVLSNLTTAFVSVSNSAANAEPTARNNARRIAKTFLEKCHVRAREVIVAGGALAYPSYGTILRWVMKQIAKSTGAPTDTSKRHELTDWVALDEEMSSFLSRLDSAATGTGDDVANDNAKGASSSPNMSAASAASTAVN